MLDDILEFIFEIVLTGVADAVDSKKLPKPVKIIGIVLGIVLTLVAIGLLINSVV